MSNQANFDGAAIAVTDPRILVLSGRWTARGLGTLEQQLAAPDFPLDQLATADASRVDALDTAGARVLQALLRQLTKPGRTIALQGMRPEFVRRMAFVAQQQTQQDASVPPAPPAGPGVLARVGHAALASASEAVAMLAFVGECALAFTTWVRRPVRIRWRPVLFNLQSAGVDALPIVGLLSFALGIVVAYQSADQLRQYGANLFIADIVGISMLREFAPLIAAIIIAGRSGSAYAAQIGTMAVTEEIDALRTLGLPPLDVLVLPKLIALTLALPLLTAFADLLGVAGGMLMAQWQLDVSHGAFLDRLVKAVGVGTLLVGIGKSVVFAAIIVLIGCFQGFRTRGGADAVGRQTTRSVVQAIFLVIVADGAFSVIFSALDL